VKSLSFRSGLALENTKVISSGRRRLRGGWWLVFARVQILGSGDTVPGSLPLGLALIPKGTPLEKSTTATFHVKVVVVDFSRGVPLRITAEHKGRLPEETTRPQVPSSLNKALLKLVCVPPHPLLRRLLGLALLPHRQS
jgi:hypothetical protein